MHPGQLVAASAIMGFGALVQGLVGFGAALVAAPLLVLVDADFVPGPMILAGAALNVLLIASRRDPHPDPRIRWAITGLVPGTAAAGVVLAAISSDGLSLLFAILVLMGVAITAVGRDLRHTDANFFGVGAISGFMGTVSGIGGPPIALMYHRAAPTVLRATLPRFFLAGSVTGCIALVVVGRLAVYEVALAAALLPGMVAGFVASGRLTRHIDGRGARPAVLGLSALAAVAVLIRELT